MLKLSLQMKVSLLFVHIYLISPMFVCHAIPLNVTFFYYLAIIQRVEEGAHCRNLKQSWMQNKNR